MNGVTGWRDKLATGWTVSAIETIQSGLPFTPQLGFNPTNNGDTRNPIRPSWNPAYSGNVVLGSPNLYFNPSAFVSPTNGTYGNVGRDTLIGPGIVSLDLSALKATALTEKIRLRFHAEFFNALNHANFSTPNPVVFTSAASIASPTAGVITATSTTSTADSVRFEGVVLRGRWQSLWARASRPRLARLPKTFLLNFRERFGSRESLQLLVKRFCLIQPSSCFFWFSPGRLAP